MNHLKNLVLRSAAVAAIAAAGVIAKTPATQPAGGAATQPAIADKPASTQPADVIALLDKMDSAYSKIGTATFEGHIIGRFDVDGQQNNGDVAFTSTFSAPNQFRHDATGDILIDSTGTNVFAFLSHREEYHSAAAPKDRAASSEWPAFVTKSLSSQNPSLLLAVSKSASAELKELSKKITLAPATVIDGVSYDTLRFDAADGQVITLLVDPATHLLRRMQTDMRKQLEKAGSADVKQAEVTVDYTRSTLDTGITADQFAWSAPTGAMLTTATVAAMDDGGGDVKDLVGKAAPDFTLKGLDDKSVKLSDQKGSVVVLDFWATWCGPCVAALPHIDALYKEQSPNGLKVFAVDLKQTKDVVDPFVKKKGWSFPVLLDSDGAVANLYKANAIPETVIIGKDGTVKKVFVGGGHETEIAAEVATQMR